MGLLEGKNALVFGLANERSIAWGITQAFKREGANIGISYAGEMLEKRVIPLAEKIDCKWVEQCDVTDDTQITAAAESAAKHFGKIDILVHSIAFAGRDELSSAILPDQPRGFQKCSGYLCLFTRCIDKCHAASYEPRWFDHVADIWLGRNESRSALQCDGRCESRAGIIHTLPGL